MNILVTGANGQLGLEINELVNQYPDFSFSFADIQELDVCNKENIKRYVISNKIDSIINCAAYTNVDKSEYNQANALNVNAHAVKNLLNSLEGVPNAKMIHISTDYVFDGNSNVPYEESFQANPINFYGISKRRGEEYIESSSIDSIVLRTSWLYSVFGNNFVKTMLRLGATKESLDVIFDQIGTPTNAKDLAKASLNILRENGRIDRNGKIYHYSNEGVASWYDFAAEIMEIANFNCVVKPILTRNYPETPAKRPKYSVMSKEKIKANFNLTIPHWKETLKECINKLNEK